MQKPEGVCRIAGENGEPNRVRISDQDFVRDIDEKSYRIATINPPLSQLPWCSDRKSPKKKDQ